MRIFFAVPLFAFAILLSGTALAADMECAISKQPFLSGACPADAVGTSTTNPSYTGARVAPHTDARQAIDAFGHCRYVGNGGDTPVFVPFGNHEEWYAYLTNHPPAVYLIQCSRGGLMPMPPNFGEDSAANQCVTMPPVQQIRVPYKPANVAGNFTSPPVTYHCASADGTAFDETAIATLESHDSGYGPGDDIGWKFSKIIYSYDGVCGPATGVPTKTAPTAGLCSVGVPSTVIGTGPFQWICASGNGGGKNHTCSTDVTCPTHIVEEKACRCENGDCYRPIYWGDTCGHSWIDKSQKCDNPEPRFKDLPPIDYDNDHLTR